LWILLNQRKAAANKVRAGQKNQAPKAGGGPKKGSHTQKCRASHGSDSTDRSDVEQPPIQPRKKVKRIDIDRESDKDVENDENEEEIDLEVVVDGDNDNMETKGAEQVSIL
jgi:hypothetical protein